VISSKLGALSDLDCMIAASTSLRVNCGSLIYSGTFLPAYSYRLLPGLVAKSGFIEVLSRSTSLGGIEKKQLRKRSAFSLSSVTSVSPAFSIGTP
jgi:hypothetical protein